MLKIFKLISDIKKDEEGAALIEYTVLLGIMLIAVIGTIVTVGGWVSTKWVALNTVLQANP